MTSIRTLLAGLLVAAVLAGAGCHTGWSYESSIRYGMRADRVTDDRTAVVTHRVPASSDRTVRVRNLAGHVRLEPSEGAEIEIVAHVHAKGASDAHTDDLLASMTWIEDRDDAGRPEWTLDWPTDRHATLHYSTEGDGFRASVERTFGRKVTITTQKGAGVPTLYADLDIRVPAGSAFHVRTLAGPIDGGALSGDLTIDTCTGTVTLGPFDGVLTVDAGAGDVMVDSITGSAHLDTGSGDIQVDTIGGDVHADTGSGDIRVGTVGGHAHLDTGSGDILIDVAEGGVHADTASGDIEIGHAAAETLTVSTGSGRIRTVLDGTRHVSAESGSGDVTMILGPDAAFDVHASLGSGALRVVGFDGARLRHDGRHVTGATHGSGGTRIHVETGSGDLTVKAGG
jgi:DUF4097 and DUF4098 domain-containing protein YvlB